MKTIHDLKDNAYKQIFHKPEMFLEFLNNFIPIVTYRTKKLIGLNGELIEQLKLNIN